MGFYNIYTEGQQADEYRARKAREEKEQNDKVLNRNYGKDIGGEKKAKGRDNSGDYVKTDKDGTEHVYPSGVIGNKNRDTRFEGEDDIGKYKFHSYSHEDKLRRDAARNAANRNNNNNGWKHTDADAINRHMRRHPDQWDGDKYIGPKKECGIFESVEFIDE